MSKQFYWNKACGLDEFPTELIDAVATKSDLTKQDSKKAVDALFETISNTLAKEEKIQLLGFGTFEVRERAERTGRNPQTGEEMTIPASKVPAFKPGKELKEAIKSL
jgi:DNA-binding protein HU-beta